MPNISEDDESASDGHEPDEEAEDDDGEEEEEEEEGQPEGIIQSTTSITDFLVVDKSSVILVKRPKIR